MSTPDQTKALLVEARDLFRFYEANHRAKVAGFQEAYDRATDVEDRDDALTKKMDTIDKAERNKAIADKIDAALATAPGAHRAESKAKGAPISDWSWWVGSDETVSEEGLYDLYETGTRDDAIGWAECHVAEGERFHIIEARTRALQGDDEFMPFVDRRNAMSFKVNSDGVAVEVARG